ncbi:MAG: hypothetical protein GF398_11480 [Chitinivibrionales bacterium]|nr:hypothetical protein [Chitinivibrionales bacterium]
MITIRSIFLAVVTQHIPNKGEHLSRYYGFYSNKKRSLRMKKTPNPEMYQLQMNRIRLTGENAV